MPEVMFRKQSNGFWFCNIGGIEFQAGYAVNVQKDGLSHTHLLQNGKYLYITIFKSEL